jgi:hypothetical protein
MQVHRPGNAAHCSRAYTVSIGSGLGRLHQARVIGQAKVIVRAKIEHLIAIHSQPGALR